MLLDKKTAKLLNILSSTSNGEYKVMEIECIKAMFPKKYSNLSYDEVSNMFNYLSDLEYVDIKYFDENEVCFAILPKSRILQENMIDEKKLNQKFALVLLLSGIISSICSFCGALLSHIILG